MSKAPPLLERIKSLQAEIDELLDRYAREQKAHCPNVPAEVLRAMVTNRAPGCHCRQAIILNEGKA